MTQAHIYKSILEILSIAQYEYLSHKDIRAIYQDVLFSLNKLCDIDAGFIFSVRKTFGSPEILSLSYASTQKPYWEDLPSSSDLFFWSETLLHKLIQEKEILSESGVDFIKNLKLKENFDQAHALFLPITYGAETLGILIFLRKEKSFSEADIEVLKSILFFLGNLIHTRETEKEKVLLFEKVKAREALLEKFIYSMPISVAVLDNDLNYINNSKTWIDYFQSKEHVSLQKTLLEEECSSLYQSIKKVQKNHKLLKKEIQLLIKGESRFLSFSVTTWFSFTGAPGGIILFCEDVTQDKLLKGQLKESIKQLKKSNDQLDYFATICAHDLREPLRTISSYSQLLGVENISEDEKKSIRESISQNCKNMAQLIQKILIYSQVGESFAVLQPLILKDLLGELEKDVYSFLKEKNAHLQVSSEPQPFEADRTQIKQLFLNLIINAVKYNESDQPMVCITQAETLESWVFKVEDNGIGFKGHAKKMLETVLKNDGSFPEGLKGLGLLIVKRVVENHRGRISVEERADKKGSIFIIELPKKKI